MAYQFRIRQGGLTVAGASAPFREDAAFNIAMYAAQYAQDGPLRVQEKVNGRWKAVAKIEGGSGADRCPTCDLPNPSSNPYCFCRP